MGLGTWEVLLVFLVVLIIFGPTKLPKLGRSLGQFIKNLKGESKEIKKHLS